MVAVGLRHRRHHRVRDGHLPQRRCRRRPAGHRPGADRAGGGRRLVISSDFHKAYQSLACINGVDPLWCWAHIRRYFLRAGAAQPEALGDWCDAWTERIAVLYRAHHALAATMPGTDAHADAAGRWQRAFTDIDAHRILQASDAAKGLLHPAAAKVIATLSNEWDGLARHQDLPQLPLDNNEAERALRTPVIGRKNFYGSGAEWAAHLAADVWTVTATAARHDIEPLGLLTGYLQACAEHGGTAPAEQAWTRSCPGPPKDAPAVVPPVTSPRVPARNPRQPAKPAHSSPSHDAEGHFVMPSGRHNVISTGSPIIYTQLNEAYSKFSLKKYSPTAAR